jgi:hypothetical protein
MLHIFVTPLRKKLGRNFHHVHSVQRLLATLIARHTSLIWCNLLHRIFFRFNDFYLIGDINHAADFNIDSENEAQDVLPELLNCV